MATRTLGIEELCADEAVLNLWPQACTKAKTFSLDGTIPVFQIAIQISKNETGGSSRPPVSSITNAWPSYWLATF